MGFAPFYDEEGVAGSTLDIAWVKCYNYDPYDLFEQYLPTEPETSEAPEESTDAPASGDATTQAPEGEVTTEPEAEKSGSCGGVVGAGVLAIVAVLGTAIVLKKKD